MQQQVYTAYNKWVDFKIMSFNVQSDCCHIITIIVKEADYCSLLNMFYTLNGQRASRVFENFNTKN